MPRTPMTMKTAKTERITLRAVLPFLGRAAAGAVASRVVAGEVGVALRVGGPKTGAEGGALAGIAAVPSATVGAPHLLQNFWFSSMGEPHLVQNVAIENSSPPVWLFATSLSGGGNTIPNRRPASISSQEIIHASEGNFYHHSGCESRILRVRIRMP